jgi:hypothetical protein
VPRSLLAVFWAMVVLTLVAVAGLALDPRTITGAPAWLKPLKFAVSTAIYSLSFGWLLRFIEGRERLRRWLARLTAAMLAVELLLIFLQAARGVGSHFNVTTRLDFAIFQVMGASIAALWVCQIVAAAVLLRQRFADPALAWSLRLGIVITTLGAAVGWLMAVHMGHTIGAPDGGPGMPLTNWSTAHGDLRTAHFFGLHGLQVLPLVAWASGRLRGVSLQQRAQLVIAAGLSYGAFLLLLVAQALRGQAVTSLDGAARIALVLWAGATVALVGRALVGHSELEPA